MGRSRKRIIKRDRLVKWDECYICGATYGVEWHHLIALGAGGEDTFNNMIPLCHSCHMRTHMLKPHIMSRVYGRNGGRPQKWVDDTDKIFQDFVHCRISKTECCERLGRHVSFTDTDRFRDFKRLNKIKTCRNNIDIILSKHNGIEVGQTVGYIKYVDGRTEFMKWKESEPLTGASSVATVDRCIIVPVHKVV